MPRIGITAYDLLISCPGDVEDYIDIIKECVNNFNRTIGEANNSLIETKHWSTNSYPESGDKPQELLNKQFVRNCDVAVALFWTRFGTPTDKYGSGTEEEIEEMLSSDKQVFMYFVDAPVQPSKVDPEQYGKIQEFKKRYESKGIYSVISDTNDFKTEFTKHLTMHFLPIVSEEKIKLPEALLPNIIVKDKNSNNISEFVVETYNLLNCKLLTEKKEECIERLNLLQLKLLPARESSVPAGDIKYTDVGKRMTTFNISDLSDVKFTDDQKKVITDFAHSNNITIAPAFWNIGNLKEPLFSSPLLRTNYTGSDEEIKRYKSVMELYWNITEYLEYKEFFSYIDKQYYVELVVSNNGNTFDEDIDIKFKIKNGIIIEPKDITIPGINIIENVLQNGYLEDIFTIQTDDSIYPYSNYPTIVPPFNHNIPLPFGKSVIEEYEENKEQFSEEINRIFCYNYFYKQDKDVVSFKIKYLKQNSTIALPSILFFKDIPEEIEYEIISKHTPDITKGTIKNTKNKP